MTTYSDTQMSHIKMHEGRRIPSVTTILSEFNPFPPWIEAKWHAKLRRQGIDPKQELERTARVGTIVHYSILSKISQTQLEMPSFPLSSYPDDWDMYVDISSSIWEQFPFEIQRPICEHFFMDTKNGYCGTADMICDIDGIRTVIDLKTSAAVRENHITQVAAYGKWFEAKQAIVVAVCPYIEKNPTFEIHYKIIDETTMQTEQARFLDWCEAWHRKYNGKVIP